VFGISLSEIMVIAVIALVVVGPQKLPGMLRTLGQWIRKLRRLTTEVRAQTGIDEILREEGIDGVHELRSLLRGEIAAARGRPRQSRDDPYLDAIEFDQGREYPVEGADSHGAMPDDLIEEDEGDQVEPDATASAAQPKATETSDDEPNSTVETSELLTANSLPSVEASPPKTS
jgi:sec-independent protein translocase protein TatB